jgi:UDP-N-acetylmuramoyl-L-alanyl-D-glutamate--2,6-diaminopimelate ligase
LNSLEKIAGVPGRFELVDEEQGFPVIVDYAHTPDSLENVLLTVKEMTKGNVFAVVGCGGDRDRTKRPLMAKIATELADTAVLTSDNPRSEDPERILDDMVEGVKGHYVRITDRSEAIQHAIANAADGDVVLIAGKGHETYQIIGNQVLDFDDREIARQAIKERKG